MSTRTKIGPSLCELYPPFAVKLAEYNRLLERDPGAAELKFLEAQVIAKAWRAGAEYGARK